MTQQRIPEGGILVWKHPEEVLRLGMELSVGQGQDAVFVSQGEAMDVFKPGTYVLSTGNLPILHRRLNLQPEKSTTFNAQVWFVNTAPRRGLRWGTRAPVPLKDPVYGLDINLRAHGTWSMEVRDAPGFITRMISNLREVDSARIEDYLVEGIYRTVAESLPRLIEEKKMTVLQADTCLAEFSNRLREPVAERFKLEGINLLEFSVESLNLPLDEKQKLMQAAGRTVTDPAPKLKKIKQLLEEGLITEKDYEGKKRDILEKM